MDLAVFPNPDRIEFVSQLVSIVERDARGFATTAAVYFALEENAALARPSDVFLLRLKTGERHPIEVEFAEDGGPFGAPNLLSLLPVQGIPLQPGERYAAVVLQSAFDPPLGVSAEMRVFIDEAGLDVEDAAAVTVFETDDPRSTLRSFVEASRGPWPVSEQPFRWKETHDEFCVFESHVAMPVYQEGEPPYAGAESGGGWPASPPAAPMRAEARAIVTIPRRAMPPAGYPAALFIRTGGGGDRPLVDRGLHAVAHGPATEPGSGPARTFARAGFAGLSVDGPHGGIRNVTNGDEQFLIFNFFNPLALRDNVRQSALEVALSADLVPRITITATGCPGAPANVRLDASRLAIMGHSMGATIAPLALANEPRFGAAILSGAGGSWIENIIHKRSPLVTKPIAERIIGYADRGRALTRHDPILSLLQWAGEPADPPVYARGIVGPDRNVLMFQGIEDTYILPPIANALSLALGLDLGGRALEPTLERDLALVGRKRRDLPLASAVVQHAEDGIEDGHEVVFQTGAPKHQYRCFLESFAAQPSLPKIPPAAASETAPCP